MSSIAVHPKKMKTPIPERACQTMWLTNDNLHCSHRLPIHSQREDHPVWLANVTELTIRGRDVSKKEEGAYRTLSHMCRFIKCTSFPRFCVVALAGGLGLEGIVTGDHLNPDISRMARVQSLAATVTSRSFLASIHKLWIAVVVSWHIPHECIGYWPTVTQCTTPRTSHHSDSPSSYIWQKSIPKTYGLKTSDGKTGVGRRLGAIAIHRRSKRFAA
ncbi:hypothetical protein C2E23DRAFT_470406 [Lenzites betulinus]|nr:hypothetical protein C2E23DRAFT_470406 [Lenzites betulinus]